MFCDWIDPWGGIFMEMEIEQCHYTFFCVVEPRNIYTQQMCNKISIKEYWVYLKPFFAKLKI